jgi:NAD(P)-dependent dehydrogenase (short-subunit alcohol dehydrogenase family)
MHPSARLRLQPGPRYSEFSFNWERAMDLQLKNTVVLITGGSKGIGLACAEAFAAEGAKVAIASRDATHLAKAREHLHSLGYRVHTAVCDLRQASAAQAMVADVQAALGPIDILVNSAGAAQRSPPAELTAAHWHAAMEAKYFTAIHAMQAVIHEMAARGQGSIVNIVGVGGKLPTPVHLPGGAANAALMLASAGLGHAFGPQGVRVNVVNPGLVATERMLEGFSAQARLTGESMDSVRADAVRRMPLGRLAEAADVARVVLFLASGAAAYVSAAAVTVDGAASPVVF